MGLNEDIDLFERGLQELIVKYEQYFLGMEKRAPEKLLTDLERQSRRLQTTQTANSMYKFRINGVVMRLTSYKQLWERTMRQIEEGRYSRDRFKAALHERERAAGKQKSTAKEAATGESHQHPAGDVEKVYRDYLSALQSCHLPTDKVSLDTIASSLQKNLPALKEKYHCDKVVFQVVVENGKPKIKARPAR